MGQISFFILPEAKDKFSISQLIVIVSLIDGFNGL